MTGAGRLYSVEEGTSAGCVSKILDVLFADAETALDMTFGNGRFWRGTLPLPVAVTGLDLNPSRGRHVIGDFRALPFLNESFDVTVFDPPYHTDMGRGKPSVMGDRFGTFPTIPELRLAISEGCLEAWRVARLGVIVKVQNYIHASRMVRMTRWVEDVMPSELFDEVHLTRAAKMIDPKWDRQLSAWRNHATFLVFRKDGQIHKQRRSA